MPAILLSTTISDLSAQVIRAEIDGDMSRSALYHDLGPDHFDRRATAVQTRRLLARLQKLGYARPDYRTDGVTRIVSFWVDRVSK